MRARAEKCTADENHCTNWYVLHLQCSKIKVQGDLQPGSFLNWKLPRGVATMKSVTFVSQKPPCVAMRLQHKAQVNNRVKNFKFLELTTYPFLILHQTTEDKIMLRLQSRWHNLHERSRKLRNKKQHEIALPPESIYFKSKLS